MEGGVVDKRKQHVVREGDGGGVGVTSGPAQASVGVKSSTHTAINTYSANMQEAAKKKYLNQRFKTSPLQRHQSASIVKS